jgi:hypothetical protein
MFVLRALVLVAPQILLRDERLDSLLDLEGGGLEARLDLLDHLGGKPHGRRMTLQFFMVFMMVESRM